MVVPIWAKSQESSLADEGSKICSPSQAVYNQSKSKKCNNYYQNFKEKPILYQESNKELNSTKAKNPDNEVVTEECMAPVTSSVYRGNIKSEGKTPKVNVLEESSVLPYINQLEGSPTALPDQSANVLEVPKITKAMLEEKEQTNWYKSFSKNLHGLKRDMPLRNMQWPPPSDID